MTRCALSVLADLQRRSLCAELHRIRLRLGIDRNEVARQTGLNSSTLWKMEIGESNPTLGTLLMVLDCYGMTLQVVSVDEADAGPTLD